MLTVKKKILIFLVVTIVAAKAWSWIDMKNLSNEVNELTESYANLEIRLNQHKAFEDSFLTDSSFRKEIQDSAKKGDSTHLKDIEKTLVLYRKVFDDKERAMNKLRIYEGVQYFTTGVFAIVLLVFIVGLFKQG
jgi:hypothetical protein